MSLENRINAEAYIAFAQADIAERLKIGPDELLGAYGISLIERGDQRPPTEDCHQYTLHNPGTAELYGVLIATHQKLDIFKDPRQAGDIVVYSDGKTILHVGKVAPNGKDVISKWGEGGHVYQHSPLMVPAYYGNCLDIYRPLYDVSFLSQ